MAPRVSAELENALAANPAARERFWALPPEQKDAWVAFVARGRFPGARRRRAADAARRLAAPAAAASVQETGAAPVALPRTDWTEWVIGLALLLGLAAFLLWLTVFRHHHKDSKSTTTPAAATSTVPKVTGIAVQSAKFQLRDANLGSKVTRLTATKPKGIVLAQAPKPGTSLPRGTAVALVVSNGPAGVAMPNVVGLPKADAVQALQARGLKPTVQEVASKQAPGTVLAQTPDAGKPAKPGSKVALQVAKGAQSVAVPDVTNQPQQSAVSALQGAGLTARTVQVPSTSAAGTVVSQSPAAGQKVAKGSAVRLNVSKGKQAATTTTTTTTTARTTTTAPSTGNDYTGMRLRDAVKKIADGRQQAIVEYATSSTPAGVVISNSNDGARVRLQVSLGTHPKPARDVPDTTSEDASTAQQDLQSAGFAVIQVTWPVSDSTQNGVVVYQTPTGKIAQGAAIVIYVGSASGG